MTANDERIAKLQEKLKQAIAKKQRIEARKRAVGLKAKRAEETRRKILVGSFVLAALENNGSDPLALALGDRRFDAFLTRPDDRALFGLPPLTPST